MSEGWACPKCGKVYSPSVAVCLYCANITFDISALTSYCGTEGAEYPSEEGINYNMIETVTKHGWAAWWRKEEEMLATRIREIEAEE